MARRLEERRTLYRLDASQVEPSERGRAPFRELGVERITHEQHGEREDEDGEAAEVGQPPPGEDGSALVVLAIPL